MATAILDILDPDVWPVIDKWAAETVFGKTPSHYCAARYAAYARHLAAEGTRCWGSGLSIHELRCEGPACVHEPRPARRMAKHRAALLHILSNLRIPRFDPSIGTSAPNRRSGRRRAESQQRSVIGAAERPTRDIRRSVFSNGVTDCWLSPRRSVSVSRRRRGVRGRLPRCGRSLRAAGPGVWRRRRAGWRRRSRCSAGTMRS
jgi:hypothetical protein